MTSPRHVVVCGAGSIGLCCAYHLLERGHRVTVLERGGPDRDCCSLGNAGFISPSHIVPLAAPGMVGRALRWMGNPESPFWVRPRLDPEFLRWGIEFWRAARPGQVRRAGPVLRDLHLRSRSLFERLAAETGNEFGLEREGLLVLFRTRGALAEEGHVAAWARELGMPADVLDARGVAKLEPELTLDVLGGVHYPLDAHVRPERFIAALTRLVERRGGDVRWNAGLHRWGTERGRIRVALTAQGEIVGDEFVIAAGSWSGALARALGVRLPLEPGKGYSVTLDAPPERPRRSVILGEARVAITPLGGALRVGGTMEFAGFDLGINPPRVRGILRSLRRYLPGYHPEDFASCAPWCGLRPVTPDGLPYLGRPAGWSNLIVATGHAMMGLSLGPVTGELVAQIVSQESPSIGLDALSPDRYR